MIDRIIKKFFIFHHQYMAIRTRHIELFLRNLKNNATLGLFGESQLLQKNQRSFKVKTGTRNRQGPSILWII